MKREREKLESELNDLKEIDKERKELAKVKSEVKKLKDKDSKLAKGLDFLKQGAVNMHDNFQAMEKESKKKNDKETPFKF